MKFSLFIFSVSFRKEAAKSTHYGASKTENFSLKSSSIELNANSASPRFLRATLLCSLWAPIWNLKFICSNCTSWSSSADEERIRLTESVLGLPRSSRRRESLDWKKGTVPCSTSRGEFTSNHKMWPFFVRRSRTGFQISHWFADLRAKIGLHWALDEPRALSAL